MERLADPQAAGFWEGLADGVVQITRCQSCRRWQHPPLERCRHCGGPLAYETVSGDGYLYSFIVTHYPAYPAHADEIPYAVGLVELEEQNGLRLLGQIESAAQPVEIGMKAKVRPSQRDGQLRLTIVRAAIDFDGSSSSRDEERQRR